MSDGDSIFKFQHADKIVNNNGAFGGVYFLAFIGSAFYYIQTANSFWAGILGIIKAVFWPGFLMFKIFELLKM